MKRSSTNNADSSRGALLVDRTDAIVEKEPLTNTTITSKRRKSAKAQPRRSLLVSYFLLLSFLLCLYLISFSGHYSYFAFLRMGLKKDENDVKNTSKKQQQQPTAMRLTRQSMMEVGATMGRSVVDRFRKQSTKNYAWWCRPKPAHINSGRAFLQPPTNTNSTTSEEGLFFVKTPKTASQSINRIFQRAITKVARRTNQSECFFRGHHIQGQPQLWYGNRNIQHSILLTSVRDPATRALSRAYWTLSTRQAFPQSDNKQLQRTLQHHLQTSTDVETGCTRPEQTGFQLNYVAFDKSKLAWPPVSLPNTTTQQQTMQQQLDIIQSAVQHQVLEHYDFILIQERLDESLVALQLLLGLETEDILSLPLHTGGSYLYDRHAGCLRLYSPPKLPHLLQLQAGTTTTNTTSSSNSNSNELVVTFLDEYFQTPTWYAQNYGDYVLLGAAHQSLDLTIEQLNGDLERRQQPQSSFQYFLERFRRMQQRVYDICSHEVIFPCSPNGTIQRDDYALGKASAAGDRYPQQDIEECIDRVVAAGMKSDVGGDSG